MAKGTAQKVLVLAMMMALPPLYYYNREGLYKIQRRLAGTPTIINDSATNKQTLPVDKTN
jgi:hypothetical protein